MLFTNLIFIFIFIPVTIIIFSLDQSSEYKNFIMILASVVFLCWGRPVWVLLILLTTLADWGLGFLAHKKDKRSARAAVALSALSNLIVFVLFTFGEQIFTNQLNMHMSIRFPVIFGIGFYCLRGFSYVMDCYGQKIKPEKNYFYILTYASLFQLFPAGPLVRYGEIKEQLRQGGRINAASLSDGFGRYTIGLAKVILIAKPLESVFEDCMTSSTALGAIAGAVVFFIFFYFLFVGYTDMSIGLGKVFGLHFPENFSKTSLSSGCTGAVMGYNTTVISFFDDAFLSPINRRAKGRMPLCAMIILFSAVLGVWFGATPESLLFCLYFGVVIVIEELFLGRIFAKLPRFIVRVYTIIVTIIGWTFFACSQSGISVKEFFRAFFVNANGNIDIVNKQLMAHCILIVFALLLITSLKDKLKHAIQKQAVRSENGYAVYRCLQTVALMVLFCTCTVLISVG